MMDRLNPKQIIVVSSAPQIRYPDCYGIDMANLEDLIAFRALLSLLKENNKYQLIDETYKKCKNQEGIDDRKVVNYVKELYNEFSADEISDRIGELITDSSINAKVKTIFQSIENLHKACPDNKGDWYFTGNYPTPGGYKVVNKAFINFYEGNKERAY